MARKADERRAQVEADNQRLAEAQAARQGEEADKQRELAARAADAASQAKAIEVQQQAGIVDVLAIRAAVWPGASEDQVRASASALVTRTIVLADEYASDVRRAIIEAAAADVGTVTTGVAGGATAIASMLGQAHPLLGIAGLIAVAVAKPIGDAIKQNRGERYTQKWSAKLGSMRQPERELFAAIVQARHPALSGNTPQISLLDQSKAARTEPSSTAQQVQYVEEHDREMAALVLMVDAAIVGNQSEAMEWGSRMEAATSAKLSLLASGLSAIDAEAARQLSEDSFERRHPGKYQAARRYMYDLKERMSQRT